MPRPLSLALVLLALGSTTALAGGDLPDGVRIELNTASAGELTRLPGIGPKRAEAIVKLREKRPFLRKEEIMRVRGIGPKMYARLKDSIYVEPSAGLKPLPRAPAQCPPCPVACESPPPLTTARRE